MRTRRGKSSSTRSDGADGVGSPGAGITGNGTYQLSILGIGARNSKGQCSQSAPPVAWHQVINASGPVTLP